VVADNIASGGCEIAEGVTAAEVAFEGTTADDFSNTSGYGANGWVLTPETFDPKLDIDDDPDKYRALEITEEDIASISNLDGGADLEKLMGGFFLEGIGPAETEPEEWD
jgi:hypothetical protein